MSEMKRPPSAARQSSGNVWRRLMNAIGALLAGPQSRADLARAMGDPDRAPDAVTRDVKALREAGFKITDSRGKSYELDIASVPLWVTPEETSSLVAAQGLAERASMPEAQSLASLLARVPGAIRAACGPQAVASFGDLAVDYRASAAHIRTLRAAIARKRIVRLLYQAPGSDAEWRVVDVARLVWVEGTLVFQGVTLPIKSDPLWKDVRDFRVDRIQTIDVLEHTWQFPSVPTFHFTFRLPPKRAYLKSDFPCETVEDELDGSFLVTLEEASLLRARRFVLRYGAEAEVLSPPELVVEMRAIVRELAARYCIAPEADTVSTGEEANSS